MKTILSCVVLLSVIVPGWLQAQDDTGFEERSGGEAVASAEGAACQIVFPSSVLEVEAGQHFVDYGGSQTGSLAAGFYVMTKQQSGVSFITNLQVTWNGVGIGGNQFIHGKAPVHLSGIIPAGIPAGSTATVTLNVYNTAGQLVCTGNRKFRVAACGPPPSGDWVLTQDCKVDKAVAVLGNLIVKNGAQLTITPSGHVMIDLATQFLRVEAGSGVLIRKGGRID